MKAKPPIHLKTIGPADAVDGVYLFPHLKTKGYYFRMVVSTGMGWEHVSVTLAERVTQKGNRTLKQVNRCPTWLEMVLVKDMFWDANECVVQFHPPMSEYVDNHPYCLHLWKPTDKEMPTPEAILGGLKDLPKLMDILKKEIPGHQDSEYLEAIYYSPKQQESEEWIEDIRYMIEGPDFEPDMNGSNQAERDEQHHNHQDLK